MKSWQMALGMAALVTACGTSGDSKEVITVTIVSGPAEGETTGSTVRFTYTADRPASTFRCTLDGASSECEASGMTYAELAVGGHHFEVEAEDDGGNASAAAERNFLVGAGPTVVIDLDPATGPEDGAIAGPSGTIEFHAIDADDPVTYGGCLLDDVAVSPCASPVSWADLADGTMHEFAVTATNTRIGMSTTATRSFTVDAMGPVVEVLTPAAGAVSGGNLSIGFTATDSSAPPVTVTCTIDDVAYPCSSGVPFAAVLAGGLRTLRIVAEDAVGNQTIRSQTLHIDTTPPTVVFDASPQWKACTTPQGTPMSKPDAVVYFTSSDGPVTATFGCTLNDLTAGMVAVTGVCAFSAEVTPGTYRYAFGLTSASVVDNHRYSLAVDAEDQVGNTATYTHSAWVVDAHNGCP